MPVAKKNTAASAAIQSGLNVRTAKAAPVKATKAVAAKQAATKKTAPVGTKKVAATKAPAKPTPVKTVKAPVAKPAVSKVRKPAAAATKPAPKPATTKTVATDDSAKAKATTRPVRLYQSNTKLPVAATRTSAHLADRAAKLARSKVQARKDEGVALAKLANDMKDRPAFWAVAKKDHDIFDTRVQYLAVDFVDGTTRLFASDNGDVLATLKATDAFKDFDYFIDA